MAEFLARGGTVTKIPTGIHRNLTDTQARIYADGVVIPVVSGELDVRYTGSPRLPLTVSTYDEARASRLDPNGHHAAEWRTYESQSISSDLRACASESRTRDEE